MPCNGARRGLEAQGRTNPQVKTTLALMKKQEVSTWKGLVKATRVKPDGSSVGVDSVAARSDAIGHFTAIAEHSMSVASEQTVMWPDQGEFVSYHMMFKSMTREVHSYLCGRAVIFDILHLQFLVSAWFCISPLPSCV
jgi:hypothetical protein